MAVVLDSTIINTAGVQARDLGSSGFRISPFTHRESSDLALNLRYGALPVDFKPATVERVSATLGTSSLHAGLVAGIVGLALVALYVLIFYRILGLVAILSLATGSAVLWTVISYLGVHSGLALTLSGITGIIVSIGVAVDSNVVFYEHLREDIAKGRTFRATVNSSFDAAWHTIVIADVVSLLGAAILYFFTLGSVRGFAFYLGLSTILDLAASWFFMRPVVMWMARKDVLRAPLPVARRAAATWGAGTAARRICARAGRGGGIVNFFRKLYSFNDDINFRRGWRVAYAVSAVFLLAGVFALLTGGLKLGIDFKGGTSWQFPANSTSVSAVRDVLKPLGGTDATIQTLTTDKGTDIRVEVGTKVRRRQGRGRRSPRCRTTRSTPCSPTGARSAPRGATTCRTRPSTRSSTSSS